MRKNPLSTCTIGSKFFNILIESVLLLLGLVGGTELDGNTLGDTLEFSGGLFGRPSTGLMCTEHKYFFYAAHNERERFIAREKADEKSKSEKRNKHVHEAQ